MLDNSAHRAELLTTDEGETPPYWNALYQVVEELLDTLGASHQAEHSDVSEHLSHLEKFDWSNAFHQGTSILRRR